MDSKIIAWLIVGSGIGTLWWGATRFRDPRSRRRVAIAAVTVGAVCIALGAWVWTDLIGVEYLKQVRIDWIRMGAFVLGVWALIGGLRSLINPEADPNPYAGFVRRVSTPAITLAGIVLILIALFGE